MLKVFTYKRFVLLLGLGLLICYSSVNLAQDNNKPFVRLATYWDAPGRVKTISADDRWIVIYDANTNMSRLVEVATGGVFLTSIGNNSIRFSPSGRFVAASLKDTTSTQIVHLDSNKVVMDVASVGITFSPDETFVEIGKFDTESQENKTRIIEFPSGKVILNSNGRVTSISNDSRWVAIDDAKELTTKVVDLQTMKTIFEFKTRDYVGGFKNTIALFSPDKMLLAIHQLHDFKTYVLDTGRWTILYETEGTVMFSSDSQYMKVRQSDGPAAPILLLEAKTGKQLDKVYGEMWFSDDSKLLYRSDATNCAYRGHMKVLQLPSMQPLVDIQKCVGFELVANNSVMEVYDEDIIASQVHQFIDVATGIVLWQIDAVRTEMIDYDRHLVQLTKFYRETIEDFVSGKVFVTEREITLSHNKQLAFASNDMFVDVYGAADARVSTMPTPRQGGGIVQAPKGKFTVYPTQDVAHVIEEESLNPFTFSVMGRSADDKWLFVTYTSNQPQNRRKAVWIPNENLTVIDAPHDLPVLGVENPLGELKALSN
ncbi:MAG: hypothetical protein GC179_30400 [Anaerolineaceae bacterium]|nr:hypothetical protein [Anaerolineaceae bacterium]